MHFSFNLLCIESCFGTLRSIQLLVEFGLLFSKSYLDFVSMFQLTPQLTWVWSFLALAPNGTPFPSVKAALMLPLYIPELKSLVEATEELSL